MPSLDEIEDFRGALERGLSANINWLLATFTRLNSVQFQLNTPRVEITVALGAATGAKRAFAAEELVRFSRYNFSAKFEVFTRPASALTQNEGESDADFQLRVNANNTLHADLVARVGNYGTTAAQQSWSDAVNFPNHFIAEALRETGRSSTLKGQEGIEQTSLMFSGIVAVREIAWQNLTN